MNEEWIEQVISTSTYGSLYQGDEVYMVENQNMLLTCSMLKHE